VYVPQTTKITKKAATINASTRSLIATDLKSF
jgi:hypothetical protein